MCVATDASCGATGLLKNENTGLLFFVRSCKVGVGGAGLTAVLATVLTASLIEILTLGAAAALGLDLPPLSRSQDPLPLMSPPSGLPPPYQGLVPWHTILPPVPDSADAVVLTVSAGIVAPGRCVPRPGTGGRGRRRVSREEKVAVGTLTLLLLGHRPPDIPLPQRWTSKGGKSSGHHPLPSATTDTLIGTGPPRSSSPMVLLLLFFLLLRHPEMEQHRQFVDGSFLLLVAMAIIMYLNSVG